MLSLAAFVFDEAVYIGVLTALDNRRELSAHTLPEVYAGDAPCCAICQDVEEKELVNFCATTRYAGAVSPLPVTLAALTPLQTTCRPPRLHALMVHVRAGACKRVPGLPRPAAHLCAKLRLSSPCAPDRCTLLALHVASLQHHRRCSGGGFLFILDN
jgi:hypothetical protein